MRSTFISFVLTIILSSLFNCSNQKETSNETAESAAPAEKKISVIFDTDTNNELDDQHALAYLLLNGNTFNVKAVTVNATFNGGDINEHYKEAERVMRLCGVFESIPLLKGANSSFSEIRNQLSEDSYDGQEAVDFIIESAFDDRKSH